MFTKQRGFAFWIRAAAIVVAVLIFLFGTFVGIVALPAGLRTPVIGLIGIVLVPVITFLTTRSQERHRARDDAIRESRTEFYGKAVRGMIGAFNIDATAEKLSPADQTKFFASLTPEFILFASRGVIRAWDNFREIAQPGTADQMVLLAAFEDVLLEMRKDLGHAVPREPNLELMALFVNDIHSLRPKKKRWMRRAEAKHAAGSAAE